MFKPLTLLLGAALLCAGTTSCQQKKTVAQLHAERQKAWQAQQRLRAIKYYGDLIQKYPDSPYAAQAKARLAALGPAATPKP